MGRAESSADQRPPNKEHIATESLTLHPDRKDGDTQKDRDTEMDRDTQLLSSEAKENIGGHNALPPLTIYISLPGFTISTTEQGGMGEVV